MHVCPHLWFFSKNPRSGGSSLEVQWLGFGAFTAVAQGSIPGQGTKIPQDVERGKNINKHYIT